MARTEKYAAPSQSYRPLLQAVEEEVPESTEEWSNAEKHLNEKSFPTEERLSSSNEPRGQMSPSCSEEANEPLLSESENVVRLEEEKIQGESKEPAKKSFSSAEYKIAFSHFIRTFSYSTRNDKALLLAAAAASICTGVTLPLMNVVFGQLVGAFNTFYSPTAGESKEEFLAVINQYVVYMIYLFIGRLCLDYIAILGFRISSIRISAAIRLAYLRSLFSLPISVLDTLPPGQTAAIITVTGSILQVGISEKLSMFLQSTSLVVTALMIAFHYSWVLTLVTSVGLIFIVVFYACTIPRLVRMMKEVEHADRMAASLASEVFASVRMIAACGAELKVGDLYKGWVDESRRRGFLMSPLVAIQQAPVFFAIHATFALSFWYAIQLYAGLEMSSVTTIIIVLMSIMTIVLSIGSISAPVSAATHAAGAASIFFSIIDAPKSKTGFLKAPKVSAQEDIVFENLNFAYPLRHDVKVLDNLNVCFPAGKVTAIVGASGSGKSTIVGLIERWYEMDGNMTDNMLTLFFRNGNITIGGQKLHEIDLKWWRSQIGLVQQEPFLFNDTIYRNIEEDSCAGHVREAFADEFIKRLPEGYSTLVGDAGLKLSGGQRQRIAIARSIVKRPKILILDEATSAIDVRGERIVQAALDKVSQGRTTIVIAHRLSTIMKADKIVVLKKGQVIQQGTHAELMMDQGGQYWGLANAQRITSGDENDSHSDMIIDTKEKVDEIYENVAIDREEFDDFDSKSSTSDNYLNSFGLFLWEQRVQWKWYALMIVGALGAGAAFPAHSYLFARLISLFNLWGDELTSQTNLWCSIFVLLAVFVFISYFVLGYVSNTISFNITATYRLSYFLNTLLQPITYFDSELNSLGALTSRIASDPVQLQQLLGLNMAVVLIALFNISGSITLSFFFGWKLTLLTLITAVPIILIAGFVRIRYETQFEKMNTAVFEESSKFASESIGAMRTVSSLVLEDTICRRYEKLLADHCEDAMKKARWATGVFAMSDSVSLLCMAFVLWYGGQLLASHEYSPFNYLVVYLAVVQGSTSAGQSMSFGPNIAQAFAAATRIRKMRPSSSTSPSSLGSTSSSSPLDPIDSLALSSFTESADLGVSVEFKNVWFKYPTRDFPVLQGLDMKIEPGQFAAIVGPSGCGKTSVISLLERFYNPTSGSIQINSLPLPTLPLSTYRSHLSLVSQEANLISGSIRDNILLGLPSSSPSSQDPDAETTLLLEKTCRTASIHEFITSLPEAYSTQLGPSGLSLSGGQKQRLALARALIRSPRLLLLDEATSALDSETERDVLAGLLGDKSGRTTIIVAHRLATVRDADIVFVMGDGRVVERGTHEGLLGMKGIYWEMCQAQALDI